MARRGGGFESYGRPTRRQHQNDGSGDDVPARGLREGERERKGDGASQPGEGHHHLHLPCKLARWRPAEVEKCAERDDVGEAADDAADERHADETPVGPVPRARVARGEPEVCEHESLSEVGDSLGDEARGQLGGVGEVVPVHTHAEVGRQQEVAAAVAGGSGSSRWQQVAAAGGSRQQQVAAGSSSK